MNDTSTEPEAASAVGGQELTALAQRVQQLEATVQALQDTKGLENRIVKRLRSRRDKVDDDVPAPEPASPAPAAAAVPTSPQITPLLAAALSSAAARPSWLLFDLYSEIKNMLAMLFDVHFRLAWTTRVVTIVILAVILTGDWWLVPLSSIPFAMKILDLILAFFLYKILGRETRRYVAARTGGPGA